MPLILETIVTTAAADGSLHLVPFGLIREGEDFWVAPFRPSPTIANLEVQPFFAAAAPADVRVIAGCVTGRRDWPTVPCRTIPVPRLAEAYGHMELEVVEVRDDPVRPRFRGRVVHAESHRPFLGHNRAVNAVLEAAILSTRLHMLALRRCWPSCTTTASPSRRRPGPPSARPGTGSPRRSRPPCRRRPPRPSRSMTRKNA